ncbi:MBL fold metallo-hydrolase [Saccharothrix sp. ST-888]|uniref:MBL fold metallo-hydrolase n=1 Tax=Saccharothrix sp. ST-888 TaxID=1427391 RepID=UPI00061FBBA6|nr:MBL fold metallo-hydrolase [Saccharothrix sp. ST-888]KJK59328.1 beta-lactamase [Saccharothrix sp. ST-888]
MSRWEIGDITVHRIDEIALPAATGPWLLPEATPQVVARHPWLRPDFAGPDGGLRLAVHSFALEIGGLRVLVDTGIGNGKTRANPAWHQLDTPYLERLTAAGFAPSDVDLVILTHLHADHVGWNTRPAADGSWQPTFTNARYLTARTEHAYWAGAELEESRRQMLDDSVRPVHEQGLLDLVDVAPEGTEIAPGLTLLPTPGHTPGQVAVVLSSGGRSAVITGDCVHHPVQLAEPAVGSCVDIDPAQAARTRARLLEQLADTDTLLLGSHFPRPTGGLVRRSGDAFRLVPQPGTGSGTQH